MLQPVAVESASGTRAWRRVGPAVVLPRRGRALAEALLSRPGWESLIGEEVRLRVRGRDYRLTPLAQGEGRAVLLAEARGLPRGTGLLDWQARQSLAMRATRRAPGAAIVCTDAAGGREVWSWSRSSPVAPLIQVEEHRIGGQADRLPVPWREGIGREPPGPHAEARAGAEAAMAMMLRRLEERSRGSPLPRPRRSESAGDVLVRAIAAADGPERVRSCWRELGRLSVLDPDCGRGEWLLGCLEALATLGLACLEHMQAWLEREGDEGGRRGGRRYPDFRRLLARRDELRADGGRERLAYETVLLRCLHGIAASEGEAEACRRRLAACVPSRGDSVSPCVADALLDVRIGTVPPGDGLRRAPDGGDGRGPAETRGARELGERALALARAEGQLARLRLELGGTLEEVAEGKQEVRSRRIHLRNELTRSHETAGAGDRLHAWLEYPDLARHGGFALVRPEAAPG